MPLHIRLYTQLGTSAVYRSYRNSADLHTRMLLQRTGLILRSASNVKKTNGEIKLHLRPSTTTPSGAILPEPKRTRFGFVGVICSVVAGLLIGATLSKMMANFLEEKELFVPSDDDDDDD